MVSWCNSPSVGSALFTVDFLSMELAHDVRTYRQVGKQAKAKRHSGQHGKQPLVLFGFPPRAPSRTRFRTVSLHQPRRESNGTGLIDPNLPHFLRICVFCWRNFPAAIGSRVERRSLSASRRCCLRPAGYLGCLVLPC